MQHINTLSELKKFLSDNSDGKIITKVWILFPNKNDLPPISLITGVHDFVFLPHEHGDKTLQYILGKGIFVKPMANAPRIYHPEALRNDFYSFLRDNHIISIGDDTLGVNIISFHLKPPR